MKSQAATSLQTKNRSLRKALRDLVAMNMRLDPTDEDRREMQAALLLLKSAPALSALKVKRPRLPNFR